MQRAIQRAALTRCSELESTDASAQAHPEPPQAKAMNLWERIGADYRYYSGAFADPAKPSGGFLSRAWSASMKLGFWVLFSYRLRQACAARGVLLRRLGEFMGLWTKIATGCHISAKCTIGCDVALPHPVGIVIGDRVVVGNRVRIFQGVTLGSSAIGRDSYPVVEDGVTIFANAVVVGRVTLGPDAVVGAGAIVLQDVPTNCNAVGNPARIVPRKKSTPAMDTMAALADE